MAIDLEISIKLPEDPSHWRVEPHGLLDAVLSVLELLQVIVGQVLSSGQNTVYLFPHLLLVLRMLCQAVECPAHATGGGVVTLKHERVHLVPDLQVAQAHPVLVHGRQQDVQEVQPPRLGHLLQEGTGVCYFATAVQFQGLLPLLNDLLCMVVHQLAELLHPPPVRREPVDPVNSVKWIQESIGASENEAIHSLDIQRFSTHSLAVTLVAEGTLQDDV